MNKKTTTLIRIDAELLEKLRQSAEYNTRSLNGQIIHILSKYIENENKQ